MCSLVYCLSPPILLPSFVSLFSLLVSVVLCWSVVFRSCVCYVYCVTVLCLPAYACLFFPFGVVFVALCFIVLLKEIFSCVWVLVFISPVNSWQNGSAIWGLSKELASKDGEALQYPAGRREDWSVRQTLLGSCSLVGDGEYLPHGHLLGRPGWAFQIPDALQGPREVAGGLHQPGSECKRLSLQGGVSCRVRSVLRAHRFCSRARSVLGAHWARSVPGAHWARSVPLAHTDSTPEPAPFCEPTQSPHQSPLRSVSPHRVRSRARSVPWAHTESAPEPAPFR